MGCPSGDVEQASVCTSLELRGMTGSKRNDGQSCGSGREGPERVCTAKKGQEEIPGNKNV